MKKVVSSRFIADDSVQIAMASEMCPFGSINPGVWGNIVAVILKHYINDTLADIEQFYSLATILLDDIYLRLQADAIQP